MQRLQLSVASATFIAGSRTETVSIEANFFNISTQTFTARIVAPITHYVPTNAAGTSNVWKKFNGESVPANTPDIIDFSYAGYKNGDEPIPDIHTGTVFNVTTYGAIPNDNRSDTVAIWNAIQAANGSGGVVKIPAGQFDVFYSGEVPNTFQLHDNVVVKGAGANGSKKGGTTLKAHSNVGMFSTLPWRAEQGSAAEVQGTIPVGSKTITFTATPPGWSKLWSWKYIKITKLIAADNLTEWASHVSSRPNSAMLNEWKAKKGIPVYDGHEIDRMEGNTLYLKSPLTMSIDNTYTIQVVQMTTGLGIEDLHIDLGFNEEYRHLVHGGRRAFSFNHAANSYVTRCRISGSVVGFTLWRCHNISITSLLYEGKRGHYMGASLYSSNVFVGYIEDWTNKGQWHGLSLKDNSCRTVFTHVGGPSVLGPDCHGGSPRWSLIENYHANHHHSSGGAIENLPHHIKTYIRWNCNVRDRGTFDLWAPGGYNISITDAILVGHNQLDSSTPQDAYVESFRTYVTPISLYKAQLTKRLGVTPIWLDQMGEKHNKFFASIYGGISLNRAPLFTHTGTKVVYLRETVDIGQVILPANQAVDPDIDTLTYGFGSGDHQKFSLNTSTGKVTLTTALDYETNTSHTFIVIVSDGDLTDEISVKVQVSDVFEMTLVADRTPAVRDAIRWTLENEHGVNFDVVETITASQLERIDDLYIFEETFSGFKDGDLQGLTGLEILYIEDNNLTDKTFPENLFSDLRSLEELVIYGNGLTSIAKRSFWNLENIKELLIGPNDLTEIDPELFIYCHGIEYISVSDTKIKTLPKDVFKGLTDLEVISLSRNLLGKDKGNEKNPLPAELFKGLSSLKNVYLEGNDLSADDIPNGTFVGLKKLETLWLGVPATTPTLSFPVTIIKSENDEVKAVLAVGAPFELELPIVITNGSAAKTSLTIKKGTTRSRALKINGGNAALDATITYGNLTKVALPGKHHGYRFHKSSDLPLLVFGGIRPLLAPASLPTTTKLLTNYPNPFNPETWIPYQLATPSDVSITIYNSRGVVVRNIKLGRQTAGYYTTRSRAAHWNGRNSTGERVATGMYFYQFKTDDMSELKKMIIMK